MNRKIMQNKVTLDWEYGNRKGFKTIEVFACASSGKTAPPISVYDINESKGVFKAAHDYFLKNKNAHLFTLVNLLSDKSEPFFNADEVLIEPLIGSAADGAKTYSQYIKNSFSTGDLERF